MQENSVIFDKVLERARSSVAKIRESLSNLMCGIDEKFVRCAVKLSQTEGHLLFTGVGKSACVAKKLASTFASLGMPSFFLHPTDMGHGDLGNVTQKDTVFFISNSGETSELLALVSCVKMRADSTVALVGNPHSTIAKQSDFCLCTGIVDEICYLGLAPTTSTTAAFVLGDTLAVCVSEIRQFKQEDFAKSHPSGNLGKLLTLRVQDVMILRESCALVNADESVLTSVLAMAEYGVSVSVVIQNGTAVGIQPVSLIHQAKMLNSDLTLLRNLQYVIPFDACLKETDILQDALALVASKNGRYFPVFQNGSFVGLFDAKKWRG
ncbi:MAG: SIS domain-containing protein [Pseudomonadota bacterium]|nr:SIS domain-containing protein [Pseudomonadota bacterium]